MGDIKYFFLWGCKLWRRMGRLRWRGDGDNGGGVFMIPVF